MLLRCRIPLFPHRVLVVAFSSHCCDVFAHSFSPFQKRIHAPEEQGSLGSILLAAGFFFVVQHAFACSRLESPSTSKTSPWLSVTAPPQNRHRELVPLGQSSSPASIKTIVVSDGVLVRPSSGLQHFFRHFFLLSPLAEGCTTLAAAAAAAASVPVAAPPESACSHQSRA